MDYRDNPQHRVLLHRVAGVYAATVVYFYSGEWRVFTPALTHGISIVVQQDCALWRGVAEGQFCYPDGAAAMLAETEDTHDQAVVDPVTAWARSELAYRKSAAGNARPSSAMRVHIKNPGFTLVETVEATIVR